MNVYDFKTVTSASGMIGANTMAEAEQLIQCQFPGAIITSISLRNGDEPKPKAIEYVYYSKARGDKLPATLPEGCEYKSSTGWKKETDLPSQWAELKRLWPKPPTPAEQLDPNYVYWVPGLAKPDAMPKGCEYYTTSGWFTAKDEPREWVAATRRWPKPEVKPDPEYMYWKPGDPRPLERSEGCEFLNFSDVWEPSTDAPVHWRCKRRWPKSVAKPNPVEQLDPNYVYWNPGEPKPAERSEGCEFCSSAGWEPSKDAPYKWTYKRRWPKPVVKPGTYTLKGDVAIIVDHRGNTHESKIPEGWEVVTEGVRKPGDMYWAGNPDETWLTVEHSIGNSISDYNFPTLRKVNVMPAIPEGYELITSGLREPGDKYWHTCFTDWQDCEGSVGSAISAWPKETVIRKIPEPTIPEGWYRVTEGRREAGDKYWHVVYKSWEGIYQSVGSPADTSEIVIRKLPNSPTIPKGWYKVTEGVRIAGDKLWQPCERDWQDVDITIGDHVSTCPTATIRKIKYCTKCGTPVVA